jgi:hypothetical protein
VERLNANDAAADTFLCRISELCAGRKLDETACEPGFQHMIDTDIVNASMKQKVEEGGGEDESEEEGEIACITAWCYHVLVPY